MRNLTLQRVGKVLTLTGSTSTSQRGSIATTSSSRVVVAVDVSDTVGNTPTRACTNASRMSATPESWSLMSSSSSVGSVAAVDVGDAAVVLVGVELSYRAGEKL